MTMRITRKRQDTRRKYSSFKLEDSLRLVGIRKVGAWKIDAPARPPSTILEAVLQRLESFDLVFTEPARLLIVDALFGEILTYYTELKVWKAMLLETDALTGFADYLIAPSVDYITTPLLCVVEAKRDDFVQGLAQCVAEMYACQWQNQRNNNPVDIYGIVTNGEGWKFYKMPLAGGVYQTAQYGMEALPELLGALHYVLGECARWVPIVQPNMQPKGEGQ